MRRLDEAQRWVDVVDLTVPDFPGVLEDWIGPYEWMYVANPDLFRDRVFPAWNSQVTPPAVGIQPRHFFARLDLNRPEVRDHLCRWGADLEMHLHQGIAVLDWNAAREDPIRLVGMVRALVREGREGRATPGGGAR